MLSKLKILTRNRLMTPVLYGLFKTAFLSLIVSLCPIPSSLSWADRPTEIASSKEDTRFKAQGDYGNILDSLAILQDGRIQLQYASQASKDSNFNMVDVYIESQASRSIEGPEKTMMYSFQMKKAASL